MPTPGIYDEASARKSHEFSEPIKRVAEELGCMFFDAGPVTNTGDDGCHLNKASHQRLASELASILS